VDASKTKLAFHETLLSRLERLEDTYDDIMKRQAVSDIPPPSSSEITNAESADTSGYRYRSPDATREDIRKLKIEVLVVKSRVDSIDALLDGGANVAELTTETSSTTDANTTSTLPSILEEQRQVTQRSIEETNKHIDALSKELSSRLTQSELALSRLSQPQRDLQQEIDGRRNSGCLADAADAICDLQQKMKLLSERLDHSTKYVVREDDNLPEKVPVKEGWRQQIDKSLAQLEKDKADRSDVESMMATFGDICNQNHDATADAMRQLREDGFASASEGGSDSCTSTSSIGDVFEGDDGQLQEALSAVEAAQTAISSLQNDMGDLISKLDEKPSVEQVKALLVSVEASYKDSFASHEALQSAIGDMHQGLEQKMTRSDVSSLISKSIEKARLGLTEEKDSLMIGRAPYRCIGCNSLFPGVSNTIAKKVNHNALPTPSIGFGRSLHAKRYFHVREDGERREGGGRGGGVMRARRPRHSASSVYARR